MMPVPLLPATVSDAFQRGSKKEETGLNGWNEVLRTVLPVLLMILTGVLCRRKHLISREGIGALKSVAVNITLPAVLLHAFAVTSYTWMDVLIPLIMFCFCLAAWYLGRLGQRLFHLPSRFIPFLTTGFEAGMLGYALFQMLYGADRTAEFARIDLGQVLFVFTVYKILLGLDGNKKPSAGELMRQMAFSPIILAILAGVLLGATGLYQAMIPSGAAAVLDACTDFVSAPTSAVILLTIGYDLVFRDIPWKETWKAVALRLFIMLALRAAFAVLLRAFWPDSGLSDAANIMFILPAPFVLPVFADDENQRVYVSSVLSVSTLVAVAGFALLAALRGF